VLETTGERPVEGPRESDGLTPRSGPAAPAALSPANGTVPRPDLAQAATAEELLERFFAYARAMLARGEAGHLELLRTMNDLLFGNKESQQRLETLFGGDEQAARYVYSLLRFAVGNEAGVVGLAETTFKTMAQRPEAFKEFDDDTLEVVTGISMVLPGIVDERRMDAFRAYAKQILDAPEGTQPEAVVRNRRRIERVLRAWAPQLAPQDALARLESGDLSPAEAAALIARLPPDVLAEVDVARWIGPLVEAGDYRVVSQLSRLRLSAGQREALDGHVLAGAEAGKVQEWLVAHYLRNTGRNAWTDARAFVESGLGRGGRAADVFAGSLGQLAERPDVAWVRWMLDRYPLADPVRQRVKGQFGIQ
jgi:hypothetical protein